MALNTTTLQASLAFSPQADSSKSTPQTAGRRVSTLSFDPTKISKKPIPRDESHLDSFLGSEFSKEGLLCTSCGETFSTQHSLDLHMKLHTAKERLYLQGDQLPPRHIDSDASSDDSEEYVPRRRVYKPRAMKYECSICQKKFAAKEGIRSHMKIHSGETPYQCPLCEKRFALGRNLHRHITLTHKEHEQNATEFCAKLMQENSSHENRKIMYTGDKDRPYKCLICSKTFKRLYRIKSHTRSHSGQKPFMCSFCSKLFSSSDNLLRHVKKLHKNGSNTSPAKKGRKSKTEKVESTVETVSDFGGHTTIIQIQDGLGSTFSIPVQQNGNNECVVLPSRHGDVYSIDGTGSDGNTQTYYIDLRASGISTAQPMEVQMVQDDAQTQHLQLEFEPQLPEQDDGDEGNNDYVSEVDQSIHHLQASETTETPQPGAYQCSLCRQTFSSGPQLTKHISIHKFTTPSKCHLCGKEFKTESYLKRHMICHTDEKPFKCSLCPKAFNRQYRLNNHWRTHTGEKPYNCSLCSKTFAVSDNLYKHIRKTHKGMGLEYAANLVKQVQEMNREKKYALIYGDIEEIEDQENV